MLWNVDSKVWQWADRASSSQELFPDTPDIDRVLEVGTLTLNVWEISPSMLWNVNSRVWQWADRAISSQELFPDTPDTDRVLEVGILLMTPNWPSLLPGGKLSLPHRSFFGLAMGQFPNTTLLTQAENKKVGKK